MGGGVFLLFIISLATPDIIPVAAVQIQAPSYGSGCSPAVARSAEAEAATYNQADAASLAESSYQFTQATGAYMVSYDSVFDGWSFNSDCLVTLKSVNIVFQLRNASGFEGYEVVTENPQLTQVVDMAFQPRIPPQTLSYSSNWSGYEFMGNADGTSKVFEAIADWSIPIVNQSPPYSGACESVGCIISAWPGIVHCPGGVASTYCSPGGIAQGGSVTELDCYSGGCATPYAYLWYEFYPQEQSPVICGSVHASPGDSVQAYVLNQGWNGGSTSLWNIQVYDAKSNQACSVTGHSFNIGAPLLAEFIAERPGGALPRFNSFGIAGDVYYGGSVKGIYTPYSNSWFNEYAMEACGSPPPNISLSVVNSANTFTETYSNSDCT